MPKLDCSEGQRQVEVTRDVAPQTLLVEFIRETLQLTGTHVGCDTSQCGACTVHLNGSAVKSCSMLAAAGRKAQSSPPSKAWPPPTARCTRCKPRFKRLPWAAMRLLHPGHGDERDRPGAAPRRPQLRCPGARGAGRQHVPLHRLSQYRQGRAAKVLRPWAFKFSVPEGETSHECTPSPVLSASRVERKRRLALPHRPRPVHRRHHAAAARPTPTSCARRMRMRKIKSASARRRPLKKLPMAYWACPHRRTFQAPSAACLAAG